MIKNNRRIVLASQSPRRRELLQSLGVSFDTCSLDVQEKVNTDLISSEKIASDIARQKVNAYHFEEDEIVITADTIVSKNNNILGKPQDRNDAVQMLHSLSDGWHLVTTGICIKSVQTEICFAESTRVHFVALTEEDIHHYIDVFKPFDKAGAYGIQEWIGKIGIDRIEGCFYNVMGLPLHRIYQALSDFEIDKKVST